MRTEHTHIHLPIKIGENIWSSSLQCNICGEISDKYPVVFQRFFTINTVPYAIKKMFVPNFKLMSL